MENKKKKAYRKKNHIIYKTTCLITKKFYIGMHSTDNIEDGYKGSGKRLKRSINKHGEENHVTEILETLPNRKALAAREKEIVNEKFLEDPQCMNIAIGGHGGIINAEHYKKFKGSGNIAYIRKLKEDPDFRKKVADRMSKQSIGNNYGAGNTNWLGKKHSPETIEKIKASKAGYGKGTSNSQFGKCWITNEVESKRINKGNDIPEGWRLGRIQKKK
jgi:hypothetical protein